jgi:protein TonB
MRNLLFLLLFASCTEAFELNSTSLIENETKEAPKQEHHNSEIVCFLGPETMPEFPGGTQALVYFIKENIEFPTPGKCIEGKVFVMFVVEEDGSISELKVAKGLGGAYDKSALEVFEKMPNWNPGTLNGHPTRIKMAFPITFRQ